MSMVQVDPKVVCYISDPREKRRQMRDAITAVRGSNHLGFVMVHLVATFIDGLAAPDERAVKKTYTGYLKRYFPEWIRRIGEDDFYHKIRCKGVHEFEIQHPFGLANFRLIGLDANALTDFAKVGDLPIIIINVERIAEDFLAHLDYLDTQEQKGKPV
jgi:hypothetical protein